jgi:hypothetical protein
MSAMAVEAITFYLLSECLHLFIFLLPSFTFVNERDTVGFPA